MHSESLLRHFRNASGGGEQSRAGELLAPAVRVDVTNPACGDMLRLSARIDDGRVSQVRFLTRGCTASIAASQALAEWMSGKSIAELKAIQPETVEDAVGGLEPASKHVAALCVDAVRALLKATR
ncbi:MAG: iron-sulfur cluster assembly scaffold protein [Bryobacteraceae bacterium]